MGERFISPCPPPTAVEAEILETLIEECAEVIQRATKMLRFGVHEVQPGQPLSNRDRLSLEVGDLSAMVAIAEKNELIDRPQVALAEKTKHEKFERYRQHRQEGKSDA